MASVGREPDVTAKSQGATHRVLTATEAASVSGGENGVLAGGLRRRYEREAEHFPAFVGTAATLIGYRRRTS
jgi:hypothetical protein